MRHALYYLTLAQQSSDNWRRIQSELLQIRRAWEWVAQQPGGEGLVLEYIAALIRFFEQRGFWREEIAWAKRGLAISQQLGRTQAEGTLLNSLGSCYSALGQFDEALRYYRVHSQ